MSEETKTDNTIRLTIRNRTKLHLIFRYNDVDYPIKASGIELHVVEAGHRISVRDPNHTKVTRQKITVEPTFFVSILDQDITIECELVGWQLDLRLGVSAV